MIQMYLSEASEDHTEVEELLEAYYMRVQDVGIQLQSLRGKIASTEEFVKVRLDSKRNALIRMDLVISVATFSVAIGGLVFGAYGMNLVSWIVVTRRQGGFALTAVLCPASRKLE